MSLNISRQSWHRLYRTLRIWSATDTLFAKRSDRLARRAETAEKIAEIAVNHRIQLNAGGTDCDGYHWDTCYLIPATVTHYIGLSRFETEWADGPAGTSFSKPEAGVFDWYDLQRGAA